MFCCRSFAIVGKITAAVTKGDVVVIAEGIAVVVDGLRLIGRSLSNRLDRVFDGKFLKGRCVRFIMGLDSPNDVDARCLQCLVAGRLIGVVACLEMVDRHFQLVQTLTQEFFVLLVFDAFDVLIVFGLLSYQVKNVIVEVFALLQAFW